MSMHVDSYRTAISRKGPSAPLKFLISKDLISFPVLDFGCGRGDDAKYLNNLGETESFDPHWRPIKFEKGYFKTVLCTYVFNVIPKEKEVVLIKDISDALAPGGVAYITVRRDIKSDRITKKGLQRAVSMPFEIIKEDSNFCIYKLYKD